MSAEGCELGVAWLRHRVRPPSMDSSNNIFSSLVFPRFYCISLAVFPLDPLDFGSVSDPNADSIKSVDPDPDPDPEVLKSFMEAKV